MAGGSGNRRGQRAVAVLRSEADFTDSGLSRERRRLALYLLVHFVDEHGRMSGAYRRVLKRAAGDPGHWAHGRSLGAVRAEVARWIGVGARQDCKPPWDRIADLVEAVVEPEKAPEVLATARYLHCRATGERVPAGEPLKCPDWVTAEHVTTAMIGGPEWARRHHLVEVAEPGAPGAPGAVKARPAKPTALAAKASATSDQAIPGPVTPNPVTPNPAAPSQATPAQAQALALREPDTRQTDTRQTDTRQPVTRLPEPRTAEALTPEALTPEALAAEALASESAPKRPDQEQRAYELLWSVVRVHREMEERHLARITALEEEVLALRAENARLTGDVTSWLGSYRPDIPSQRQGAVASRHLALEDPSQAFTYPLPAELPDPRA